MWLIPNLLSIFGPCTVCMESKAGKLVTPSGYPASCSNFEKINMAATRSNGQPLPRLDCCAGCFPRQERVLRDRKPAPWSRLCVSNLSRTVLWGAVELALNLRLQTYCNDGRNLADQF